MSRDDALKKALDRIRQKGGFRTLESIESPQAPYVSLAGRTVMNLCANDYLALANDPRLCKAAADAAQKWGAGAGASRLLSGHQNIHEQLETASARFVGTEAALLFTSGYTANVGLLSAVAGANDTIFSDALNHASIIDGCRLSKAKTIVYDHLNVADLEQKLAAQPKSAGATWIVSESYFSMDGQIAPLKQLAALADQYEAGLIVDEAHALGVWGGGRGLCAELGITKSAFALMATYGKSLGSQGAFVAGSKVLRDFLINAARSFIFSTAPAPPSVAAAIRALGILEQEGKALSCRLLEKSETFRQSLIAAGFSPMQGSTGQIVPLLFDSTRQALEVSAILLEHGIFARAIRPPTVPKGTSRIRFSVNTGHRDDDLKSIAGKLKESMKHK